jgi:hypothetical protein
MSTSVRTNGPLQQSDIAISYRDITLQDASFLAVGLLALHRVVEAVGPARLDQLLPRTSRNSPSDTSRETALPAATMASAPIRTGAISAEFEPMKARSPITVRYLK